MKVVILCGGRGIRMDNETLTIPKPMVEVGSRPILWHIMKIFSSYGLNDFILCLGYKGYLIKEYFSHYFMHMNDVTIDLGNNSMQIHTKVQDPWKVTLVDTGIETMTGSRIKKVSKYIKNQPFMLTYGDGLADIDINKLVKFHQKGKKIATVSAVQSAGRFGVLKIGSSDKVKTFLEKPTGEGSWVSAGFFVLEPEVFDYIKPGNNVVWEREPLETLAKKGQLQAYKHEGFWQCMDTAREKIELENLWNSNNAPWKKWK